MEVCVKVETEVLGEKPFIRNDLEPHNPFLSDQVIQNPPLKLMFTPTQNVDLETETHWIVRKSSSQAIVHFASHVMLPKAFCLTKTARNFSKELRFIFCFLGRFPNPILNFLS